MKRLYPIILFLVFISCRQQSGQVDIPAVVVSIPPQKYFIEQITGDLLRVEVLLPPGASPATYEPTASQMLEFSHATLYIMMGELGFEKNWLGKISDLYPDIKILNLSEGVEQGHHLHGGEEMIDPHIWMSPRLVKKFLPLMYNELAGMIPGDEELIQSRYHRLMTRIDSIDIAMKARFMELPGQSFLIYHPSLSYFSDDYGLEQIAIEWEGKEPSPAHMRKIIDTAREKNIKTILVQREFHSEKIASIAREIEGEIVIIDPLSEDWFGQMGYILEVITEILRNE